MMQGIGAEATSVQAWLGLDGAREIAPPPRRRPRRRPRQPCFRTSQQAPGVALTASLGARLGWFAVG